MEKYFGKFRGVVVSNLDPMQICRIQVHVPDVYGESASPWAMPCLPVTGQCEGLMVLPSVGSAVWVEFERGDSDRPIWVGGFWRDAAELTTGNNGFPVWQMMHNGGLVIGTVDGARIRFDKNGFTLESGKGASITLRGPEVSINHGALSVI